VFPPLTELTPGCCTVVVRPGEDIQAAIDSLPEEGGCVCLKVGEHEIEAPIRIEQSNVSLHGETVGARVVRKNGTELLHIGHPNGLLVEHVTVSGVSLMLENKGQQGQGLQAMVAIDRCRDAALERCLLHAQVPISDRRCGHQPQHRCARDRLSRRQRALRSLDACRYDGPRHRRQQFRVPP
jgi:hypothetical protein